jgi:hypothetical protein
LAFATNGDPAAGDAQQLLAHSKHGGRNRLVITESAFA